ncbi:MAG: hypothetical protein GF416_03225 [Candidatus Altiarchaeales archaeon]|nr:hypothetical protein [Candidatus Altiarchaeales archaeon]MBD3416131.1 hypothetical protein [Candidatus Altiarchaeales archaeon]
MRIVLSQGHIKHLRKLKDFRIPAEYFGYADRMAYIAYHAGTLMLSALLLALALWDYRVKGDFSLDFLVALWSGTVIAYYLFRAGKLAFERFKSCLSC